MKFEFMPRYTKYLCWYQNEMRIERSCGYLGMFSVVGVAVIVGLVLTLNTCDDKKHQPAYKSHYSNKELKLASIFAHHGSSNPFEMAIAVCKTKEPALMAAMAIKESNGDPKAIGDNGDSKGAWQVQAKHWSRVPSTASEQALQAEKILEELVASTPRGSLRSGLAKYNGGDNPPKVSYRYARGVIKLSRAIRKEVKSG